MKFNQEIYTTSEVAELLGVTHGRISQIARARKLGKKLGTVRIFTQEDVEKIREIPDRRSTKGKKIGI